MHTFDYQDIFDYVVATIRERPQVKSGFCSLLAYCDSIYPRHVWKELADLDVDADVVIIRDWLANLLTQDPPESDINILCFGIGCYLHHGSEVYALHVMGIPEDEFTHDYYKPRMENQIAPSSVFDEISRLIVPLEADYSSMGIIILCLGYAALALDEVCRQVDIPNWNGRERPFHVYVGFDYGTYIRLLPAPVCIIEENTGLE